MTECDRIDLIGYMEGIDPQGKTADHLTRCPQCRSQLHRYRLVMQTVAAAGPQGCSKKKAIILDALKEEGPDPRHLADCPECRLAVARLDDELQALDHTPPQQMAPLPDKLKADVGELKAQHQRARVEKVLDLQGIKDQRERKAAARRLMEETPEDLPKAAFPEDLADEGDDDDP